MNELHYANDGKIVKIGSFTGINGLNQDIRSNGYKITAKLLTDDTNFMLLYDLWLEVCINYMWYCLHEKKEEFKSAPQKTHRDLIKHFYQGADEAEAAKFLDSYRNMLTRPGFPNVGNSTRAKSICYNIEKKMEGTPAYMRRRVEAVCLLTNCSPEELFEEGQKWINIFPMASDDFQEVKDGTVFDMDPVLKEGETLFVRTLRNNSSESCTITLQYHDRDVLVRYPVRFPPYGVLRAVFADAACTKLVFVKGNISCGDANRAIIQLGGEKGMTLWYASRFTKPVAFPKISFFLDAAADELGGAVILSMREFYSTVNRALFLEKGSATLPIRCFRAGKQWARLYADGSLESNLMNREKLTGVTAVVADGERGLLVCQQGKAWDYRGDGLPKEITIREFCERMMARFDQDEPFSEVVTTELMQVEVTDSGVRVVVN